MGTVIAILAALVVVGLAGAGVVWHAWHFLPGKRHTILITLVWNDKIAARGVLFARHGEFVVLKSAAIVDADGNTTGVDGDLILERRHIGFYQVLPPAS